jgi:hypothetical protein
MGFNLPRQRSFVLLIVPILVFSRTARGDDSPLRAYFVGNSVTATIRYGSLAKLAKSRGHTVKWGRDMIPGAPLSWLWEHSKDGFQEAPFGLYHWALSEYRWDVVSLQLFDRHLVEKDGDLAMDGIHFNNVGSYVAGTTFHAALFRDNPMGMTADPYNQNIDPEQDRLIDEKLAAAIQDAVWTVVSKHPLAGVRTDPTDVRRPTVRPVRSYTTRFQLDEDPTRKAGNGSTAGKTGLTGTTSSRRADSPMER